MGEKEEANQSVRFHPLRLKHDKNLNWTRVRFGFEPKHTLCGRILTCIVSLSVSLSLAFGRADETWKPPE